MNFPEAEAIASAVSIIRPAWLQSSLTKMLFKLQHRPARQVALALVYLAYDPEVESPGLLLKDGPWWSVASLTEPTYTPPAGNEPVCPIHGDRQPCRGCRADELAGVTTQRTQQPADQDTVRAIRAQIREEQA